MNTNINNEYLENIRKAFFGYNSFGLWKLEQKFDQKGNPLLDKEGNPVITKVPYSAYTLRKTDPTNASNGASIDKAISVLKNSNDFDGLALFLTHDLYFIDLDKVLNDDNYTTLVDNFLQNTDTYTEISQSKTGLHIIGKGRKQTDRCKKKPVEIYDKQRFVALTGNVFDGRDTLNEIPTETTKYFEDKYLGGTHEKNKCVDADVVDITVDIAKLPTIDTSEEEIIKKLEDPNYRHSEKFKKLFYDGDWQGLGYESQSNADLSFMNMLFVFTKGDYWKTKNIFDRSALLRDKTHSKRGNTTYFNQTFTKVYLSYQNKKNDLVYVADFRMNDKDNADKFLQGSEYGDSVLWVEDQKKWMTFRNGVWSDKGRNAENFMTDFFDEIAKKKPLINAPSEEDNDKILKAWHKYTKSLGNRTTIENALYFVKNKKNAILSEFDQDDYLLNCKNGILDLKTFDLLPRDAQRLMSKQIATNYNPDATCPLWEKFIDDIFLGDQELIKFVKRCAGYSLTGDTSEQVMFLLVGKGSNGKGVFTGMIQEMLGSDENYSTTIQADSLLKAKNRSGHSDDIASLRGARFVPSSEPNENEALNEGLVKQLTGGDMVSASFKGGHTFSFKPKFKIWLSTNHMPHIAGTDDGIWRRLIIIPFDRQFMEAEKDKHLIEKLKSELSGILNWCLEGLKEYNRIGLAVPEHLKAIKKDVRQDYNPIARFIGECCESTDKATTQQKELLNAYNDWANENGEKPLSNKAFGGKIRHIENVSYRTKTNGMKLYNIRIKDSYKSYIDTVHF